MSTIISNSKLAILKSYTMLTAWRIVLLYLVTMLMQIVFYLFNAQNIGTITWGELPRLLAGAFAFNTVSILYTNTIFILLSLLPLKLCAKKWYRSFLFYLYMILNTALIVVTNIADTIYFHYTQKRLTADEVFFADNSNSLQLIAKFAGENWPLLILGVVFVAMLAVGYRKNIEPKSPLGGVWFYVAKLVIITFAALLSIAGMRGGISRAVRPITLSNAMLYASSNPKANLILSNPFCILRTISSSGKVSYQKYFSPQDLNKYFSPHHASIAPMSDSLAGRNVMIFIIESMSAEHSAYLYPDLYADNEHKGFTPFLDSLMSESFTFTQMFANGTRSIQAMPSVMGSIPSFKTPFVLMPQSLGESRQLPQILADRGYSTLFMCGSERGSMGFGAYARSSGVQELYSREEYEASRGVNDFDGYWGIWDEKFIDYAGEVLSQTPQPFFATLFTLTAHHPFVTPSEYDDVLPSGYTKIHRGVAYDDMSFKKFYNKYQNQAWFDNTIFVFVADHVSSEKYGDKSKEFPGTHHIMGFIHTPDGALKGRYDKPSQQIDIMPTLLGILGTDEPYFAYGRDVIHDTTTPWAVMFDSKFKTVTHDAITEFDENEFNIIQRSDSVAIAQDNKEVEQSLKALIQQYYTHIEKMSYK